jgi:rhamnose utilization protein RhaD (predicted bifunctional aldolase and dehydrogenase)/NAD(P)-dependent dehydrogenase (short-subunit alcohol dehydrogenase family)
MAMTDRWDDDPPGTGDVLDDCVYASRRLGAEPTLVLHGGGNTSVKTTVTDVTGETIDVLHVKGSGWDLATIDRPGFTALRLDRLRALLRLSSLDDARMMNELLAARLDASAPDPSVESLLHALLPYASVLHTHADAVIALTNQADPEILHRVYRDDVLAVDYVMPGFDLAHRCAHIEIPAGITGIVLRNHGLFTFGDTAEAAYRRHIALVARAEAFVDGQPVAWTPATAPPPRFAAIDQARLRRDLSTVAGAPMVLSRHDDPKVRAFVTRADLVDLAGRGPLTPDHVIRTKRVPLVGADVGTYTAAYQRYFDEHRARRGAALTMLDAAPRVLLSAAFGMLTAGARVADADIAADIYRHTIDTIERAQRVGRYTALPAADLFDVEYWELEQAKLKRGAARPPLTGEVALVTGAASGIGRACVEALRDAGAAVIGLDRQPCNVDGAGFLGLEVDVTDQGATAAAIGDGVARFGGVDIAVVSAGVFAASQPLAVLDSDVWRRTMAVNAGAVATLFAQLHPLLALAPRGGRAIVVGSKNVPAPGPGAAAYSASKAAATQLARVAALEWASDGIRVNVVHPDAVFDTGLWTPELLAERAKRYGLTVDAYKRRNLLGAEITSARVGALVATLCGDAFAVTTGAQIPIDGGNERVI